MVRVQRFIDDTWGKIQILSQSESHKITNAYRRLYSSCPSFENLLEKVNDELDQDTFLAQAWNIAKEEISNRYMADNLGGLDDVMDRINAEAIHVFSLETPKIYARFNDQTGKVIMGETDLEDYEFVGLSCLLHYAITEAGVLSRSITVYRGLGNSRFEDRPKVGGTLCFPRFTSTSISEEEGRKFARGNNPTLLVMTVTSYAMSIEKLSACEFEKEYLLPPGVLFTVTSIDDESEGLEVVYLKETRSSIQYQPVRRGKSKVW